MTNHGTFWLPFAGSTIATEVDAAFYFILYVSIFFFLLITIGSVYFVYKYKRNGKAGLTYGVDHSTKLEVFWTVIPSILLLVVFFWGFNLFLKLSTAPKDSLQIRLTGQKWFWTFTYPEGVMTTNELVIPVGKPVALLMNSKDVIHSFFVPEFRTKFDVIPNRYTQTWFEAVKTGEYQVFCAEYCGTNHSQMLAKVKVVSEQEYQTWLQTQAASSLGAGLSLAQFGEQLHQSKTCFTCHSLDGSKIIGPTFKGIFGRKEKMADGSEIVVDENYLRESMLNPAAKIVAGYQPVMPAFQGLLQEREVDALIEFIKTLK